MNFNNIIKNINFYDEDVSEAFEITLEIEGETKTFDIRPSDEGFNIYNEKSNLINVVPN